MIGIDTNILIYARVADAPWHRPAAAWLDGLRDSPAVWNPIGEPPQL